ncbi:MAG: Coenzyme F420 hydrogenase/dehydrogenase, beta subunit C-terminal domain [Candidatus Thermochlorobacter sp.]
MTYLTRSTQPQPTSSTSALPLVAQPKETLCSSCGLCQVRAWPAKESFESCVFELGWLGEAERALYGRERSQEDLEEMRFGIMRARYIARLRSPIPEAQWSGIITRLAAKALETGMVEAVATLHRSKVDYFFPEPVLARTSAEVYAARGNKPVISPTLKSLDTAYRQGVKKLLVIGASCHIHVLRDFQRRFPYLREMQLLTIGIPCVDNVKPKKLRWALERISKSPSTVRHYEFMQDFTVHLKHENGELEKVPYFSLPRELSQPDVFAPSCMSCFDYMNGLSDITIGYAAAPLVKDEKRQFIIVRTEKGETLFQLIKDELEFFPEESSGNCADAVKMNVQTMLERWRRADKQTGRRIPIWLGKVMAFILSRFSFKGVEFARYSIDFHLIRNYYFVKERYPEKLQTLVPKHVYRLLEKYGFEP